MTVARTQAPVTSYGVSLWEASFAEAVEIYLELFGPFDVEQLSFREAACEFGLLGEQPRYGALGLVRPLEMGERDRLVRCCPVLAVGDDARPFSPLQGRFEISTEDQRERAVGEKGPTLGSFGLSSIAFSNWGIASSYLPSYASESPSPQ